MFLETDLRSRRIEAVFEVDGPSRGKRYLIAADAGGERVKPLITQEQPFLVWSHRGCYIRTTWSNLRFDSDIHVNLSVVHGPPVVNERQYYTSARYRTRLSRVKLICVTDR